MQNGYQKRNFSLPCDYQEIGLKLPRAYRLNLISPWLVFLSDASRCRNVSWCQLHDVIFSVLVSIMLVISLLTGYMHSAVSHYFKIASYVRYNFFPRCIIRSWHPGTTSQSGSGNVKGCSGYSIKIISHLLNNFHFLGHFQLSYDSIWPLNYDD